jgi:hypothetical protein
VVILASRLPGGEFDPVIYELSAGSILIDDCDNCDRPIIEYSLRGTMVLTRLPVRIAGNLYSVTDIFFTSVPGVDDLVAYTLMGSGELLRKGETLLNQSMNLDVTVNAGLESIHLAGEVQAATTPWPAVDLWVVEDGQRDPMHIFKVRVVAAPKAGPVLYELVPGDPGSFTGSFFVDDCIPCAKPTIPVPLAGTFLLRPVDGGGANPIQKYALEGIDLATTSDERKYIITGEGSYAYGGEVALLQSMELTVMVNDQEGVILARDAASIPKGVAFPDIECDLEHLNPATEFQVYSMIIVARPATVPEVEFRRGDANADGGVDISDSIFILNWLFMGSQVPSCLDAADSNGDGQQDLSDAVRLILFLFQGGIEPPWPGTSACAAPEQLVFGCKEYLTC